MYSIILQKDKEIEIGPKLSPLGLRIRKPLTTSFHEGGMRLLNHKRSKVFRRIASCGRRLRNTDD